MLFLMATLWAGSAFAATTPWQDVAPSVRMRLITSDVRTPDGATTAGLEIDMPHGFKTYWRLPGETGIPTTLDTAGSTGITGSVILWPYPAPDIVDGYLDYVYKGPTVLPITLAATTSKPVLKAAFMLGVCSDICVPVHVDFKLPLNFSKPDAANDIRLDQARAQVPLTWPGPGAAFGAVSFDAQSGTLRIEGLTPGIDPASLIASSNDPTVIFGMSQKSPDGQALVLPLRGKPGSTAWQNDALVFDFMTPSGSYEVVRALNPVRP